MTSKLFTLARRFFVIVLFLLAAIDQSSVSAGIMLTSQGVAAGFGLSTFADGFQARNMGAIGDIGPLGIGFTNSGGILVSDVYGDVRHFASNMDGQSALSVPPSQNYGFFSALGMANDGSSIYLATHVGNQVVQINGDGTFNRTVVSGINIARDIVVNSSNGHLFVSSQVGIWDVDPISNTKSLVLGGSTDGLSIDGNTLYAARGFNGTNFNSIQGFDIGSWSSVFDSGVIFGVDGLAVGSGSLAGKIYGNTNNGQLWEVSLSNPALKTLIADGGSRGDLIRVDPNSNSLLFVQSDSVMRLTAPIDGGFGSNTVPEPSSIAILGLMGLITFLRGRKANCEG